MGGTCNVQFTPLWIRFFQCRSARYLGCIGLVKSLVFGAVCFDILFSCDVHRAVWSRDDGLNFPVSRDFCNFSLLFLSRVLQGSYVSCPPARKGRMKWTPQNILSLCWQVARRAILRRSVEFHRIW